MCGSKHRSETWPLVGRQRNRSLREEDLQRKGKPETFDFLGFTHISGKNGNGSYAVRRITIRKRMRKKLQEGQAATTDAHARSRATDRRSDGESLVVI
ncbi:hypothetical protein [Edaphobacter sp. HDX4]|uniref:hypothetical protein n=1 Tax=Edaphobacter sp. HDX4 TaxID=2794064 RepID=UPI002FE5D0A7